MAAPTSAARMAARPLPGASGRDSRVRPCRFLGCFGNGGQRSARGSRASGLRALVAAQDVCRGGEEAPRDIKSKFQQTTGQLLVDNDAAAREIPGTAAPSQRAFRTATAAGQRHEKGRGSAAL